MRRGLRRFLLASTLATGTILLERPVGAAPLSSLGDRILAASPGGTLTFSVGDDVRVSEISRAGLSGSSVTLRESAGALIGRVGTEPVTLRLEPGHRRVTGQIGDHPVSLDVLRSKDGRDLKVFGRFGVRAVVMDIRPNAIEAALGPCRYHLTLLHGRYEGEEFCGGAPSPVKLTIPVTLVARSDVELAAMLTSIMVR